MPIKDIDTFAGNADALLSIIKDIQALRGKLSLSHEDARVVALDNCEANTSAVVMIQRIFAAVNCKIPTATAVVNSNTLISPVALCDMMGTDISNLTTDAGRVDDLLRLGYVILYQFQIENLFKNLMMALGTSPPTTSWHSLANDFLKKISVKDKDRSFEILNILALLRNSYHSNGIHNPPPMKNKLRRSDVNIVIDSAEFKFINGERVTCAGWAYVEVAIRAGLKVLDEILFSTEIVSLKAPVKDEYVTQRLAK